MIKNRKLFIQRVSCFLMVVMFVSMSLMGCSSQESMKADPAVKEKSDPLVIKLEGVDAGYPTPFAHAPKMRGTVMKCVFDSLLEPDEKGYIPWLAESWQVSDDQRTYTFNIRHGVKWHDGEELTAQDVAFSFNYYQEHPPVFTSEVLSKKYLLSIEAVSDYQVKLVTAQPEASFLSEAGMMRIIPKHIWENVDKPNEFRGEKATIGCGPYTLAEYSKEHKTYRYVAFKDYSGPKQRIEAIEFVPVSDTILALENGDIDIGRITPNVRKRFEGKTEFKISESPALAGTMITFNMNKNELFKNQEFRQALAYAMNKEEIITKVLRGLAKPGSPGILPIDHQYYNSEITNYKYNPEKAKELLQKAGINKDITIELLVGEGSEIRIGELLKEQLAVVGVKLKVVAVDSKSKDAKVLDGNYEMALISMGSWGLDPDFLRVRYSSETDKSEGGSATALLGANQGYQNTALDKLLTEQRAEVNPEKRKLIINQIQQILAEDVPEIALFNNYYLYAYNVQKYNGWTYIFDHPVMDHAKLSYLKR